MATHTDEIFVDLENGVSVQEYFIAGRTTAFSDGIYYELI